MSKWTFWRHRRYQALGIAVALIALALISGNLYLAHQYEPEGTLNQYLTAIQHGDAAAAWNAAQVAAPGVAVTTSLTDEAALRAALAAGRPDLKAFDITGAHFLDADGTTEQFDVTYDTSTGSKQTKFVLQSGAQKIFGLYPTWHVVVEPSLLKLTLQAGGSPVAIDGKHLALPDGQSTLAVWPLAHRIVFGGSAMLAFQTVALDAFAANSTALNYTPELTTAGERAAVAAVKAAFDACAQQTGVQPDGCPQHVDDAFITTGSWQIVGDPTTGIALSFDQGQKLRASGHFQMVFGYQEAGTQGTLHQPSSGPYTAALTLTGQDITVTSIQADSGGAALARPQAATDQAAIAVVAKGLAACAQARVGSPADCPQSYYFPDTTNFRWTLAAAATAGATVAFDPSSGQYTVHGAFAMSASYDRSGYHETASSSTTAYTAYLLWDGQEFDLVTIAGGYA